MSAAAVIVAGGRGTRLGKGPPKQFRLLGGKPLLLWSCRALRAHRQVSELVVVVPPEVAERVPEWLAAGATRVVPGGATRRESVSRGIEAVVSDVRCILVHDAARPFVSAALTGRVLRAATDMAAIPVLPVPDTVKEIAVDGLIVGTVDRDRLRCAQTPQAFPADLIRELHGSAGEEGVGAPDDAFLCERRGLPVQAVEGDPNNLKITTPADFALAEWMVATGRVRMEDSPDPSGGAI